MANKRIFETLIKTLNVWSTKIVPTLFCTFNREPEIQQNARAFGSSMAERQPKSLRSTNAGFSTILLSTTLRFYYILSTKNTFYKAYLTEECSNNPTGQLFCAKNLFVEVCLLFQNSLNFQKWGNFEKVNKFQQGFDYFLAEVCLFFQNSLNFKNEGILKK